MPMRRVLTLLIATLLVLTMGSANAQATAFIMSDSIQAEAQPLVLSTGEMTLGGAIPMVYSMPPQTREQVLQPEDVQAAGDARIMLTVMTNISGHAAEVMDCRQLSVWTEPSVPLTVSSAISLTGVQCLSLELSALSLLDQQRVTVHIDRGMEDVQVAGIGYALETPYTFTLSLAQDTLVPVTAQAQVFSPADMLRPMPMRDGVVVIDDASLTDGQTYTVRVATGIAYAQSGAHAGSDTYVISGLEAAKTEGVLLDGEQYIWEATVQASDIRTVLGAGQPEATMVFSLVTSGVGGRNYAMAPCAVTFRSAAPQAAAVKAGQGGEAPAAAGGQAAGTAAANGAATGAVAATPEEVGTLAQYGMPATLNTQPPAAVEQPEPASTARIVGVQEFCNVRSGPGTNYPEVGRAYLDETVELIERKGEWAKCYFNGYTLAGWIHSSFLGTP